MSIMFNGLEISTLRRNGVDVAQAYYMGHELLNVMPSTPEEWMQDITALKAAANDLSVNGTSSEYYSVFYDLMMANATFPVQLRNVNSYTSVAKNKVMNCRIVGINFKDKADGSGKAGLTFMAKRAHPKASIINGGRVTTGGYSSMAIRTYLNSGDFWNSLPVDLQSAIVEVTNKSYEGRYQYRPTVSSNDKLWLPSWFELCGSSLSSAYRTSDGPQFPWFATKGTTDSAVKSTLANMYKTNSGAKPYGSENTYFWTRSTYPSSPDNFFLCVAADGSVGGNYPNTEYSVLPCFSI